MKKNDKVYTPRFCMVVIEDVFGSKASAIKNGFNEPTYYNDPDYGVLGKSIDMYHMAFAAYRK